MPHPVDAMDTFLNILLFTWQGIMLSHEYSEHQVYFLLAGAWPRARKVVKNQRGHLTGNLLFKHMSFLTQGEKSN